MPMRLQEGCIADDAKLDRFHVTFFPNQSAQSKTEQDLSLCELRDEIQNTTATAKDRLPWLKLAIFGDKRTDKNCLRFDKNVEAITGIELDYDAKVVSFEDAIATVTAAGLMVLAYTSANYKPEAPKWRLLLPTSATLPPNERSKLVARVNGLFGGIFSKESFTLSQSYYYGGIDSNPSHRAVVVEGDYIDLRDDLDAGAIGKPQPTSGNGNKPVHGFAAHVARIGDGEGLDGFNHPLCSATAAYVAEYGRDFDRELLKTLLVAIIEKAPKGPERTRSDIQGYTSDAYLDALIETAINKFGSDEVIKARTCPYEERDGAIYWLKPTKDGVTPIRLCNFTAKIIDDLKLDDGFGVTERRFVVEGSLGKATIPATKYDNLAWVTERWGKNAVIVPGSYHKEHLANAMKSLGPSVVGRTVYTHLGWRQIDGRWVYLHGGDVPVEMQLGDVFAHFALPPVHDLRAAVLRSLDMISVALPSISYPLWGAVYRAPLGEFAPVTLSLWLVGASGVFKTAIALLVQAHYAPRIGPKSAANWSSTANANERLAFQAKDTVLLIDDFAPHGTAYEVARLHAAAERLLRNQANRAGRQRMNADATLKAEMFPRGLLLGTGEDVPHGHSLRARLVTVEVKAGDINRENLTALQAHTAMLGEAMAGYVAWLAPQDKTMFAQRECELRATVTGPHARVPENIASLQLGVETGLRFAVESDALSEAEVEEHRTKSWETLLELAQGQEHFLKTESPAERFIALIRSALLSGRAHVANQYNGGKPNRALSLGWQEVAREKGEEGKRPETIYRGQGRCIGWVDDKEENSIWNLMLLIRRRRRWRGPKMLCWPYLKTRY